MDKAEKIGDALEVKRQGTVPVEMNFYRIEALRAASRIVASTFQDALVSAKEDGTRTEKMNVVDSTIYVAEQFAKYLEGE